jgi:hypothetical protein
VGNKLTQVYRKRNYQNIAEFGGKQISKPCLDGKHKNCYIVLCPCSCGHMEE